MNSATENQIGIIGAGIGGLATGALLSKRGYQVHIYEKQPVLGGRALSLSAAKLNTESYQHLLEQNQMHLAFSEPNIHSIFKQRLFDGYHFDLGYHAIGGGAVSSINKLFAELNDHVDMFESNVGFIDESGYVFPFLSTKDKLMILPRILQVLFAREKTMKQLDSVSIQQTINRYGRGKMKLILEVFSRSITTVNDLERISTGEMFRSQRNLVCGSKPVGYPKQGLSVISDKLAQYITKKKGKIYHNTPVDQIVIEKGVCQGIRVGKQKLQYPYVVSNVLVQNLFSIADKSHFPKDYVKNLQHLKGTGSLCAYYSLQNIKPELLGKTFHFLQRNIDVEGNAAVGMIDFMAAHPSSGLAPSNQYLVQSYIICTPKEAADTTVLRQLKETLDSKLTILLPDYKSKLNWAIYPAVTHLDGVAKTIDHIKPDIRTPIENLYLVGDCVKAPGIGINCAIHAAQDLVEMITKDERNKR